MNNSAEQKKRETIVDTRNPEVWHRTAKERVWQKKKHSLHFVGRLGAERTLFFFEVFFSKSCGTGAARWFIFKFKNTVLGKFRRA
jgi:hypothetical protein